MAGGKYFIQLFPPVMGSCFPPTGVKTRKLGFDSDCRGFFGYSNFLGICSKTSRNRSCLQRKLLLRGLVGMLARPLSQFCEHGLRHQQLHHIEQQRRSYTHPQMCRTNILWCRCALSPSRGTIPLTGHRVLTASHLYLPPLVSQRWFLPHLSWNYATNVILPSCPLY